MSLHIAATTGCNLGCTYCYENPSRERSQEWVNRQYDIDKIMEKLDEWKDKHPNQRPGMHGGEPLLVKKEHLRKIWTYIDEHWPEGSSHIQTNGTLIDDEHIEMFREFNVHVGISCDGPLELNRLRKAAGERGSEDANSTDMMTERTHESIETLIEDPDISCGVITVLSKQNAGTDEKFEILLDWMDYLTSNGIQGHFNPAIPYEDVQNDVSLSPERLTEVYLRTWEWYKEEPYHIWGPHRDYIDNLLGLQVSNCVNNKCDVFNAGAAKIVKGNGEQTGCGKTWSQVGDGVPFLQGPSSDQEYNDSEERYEQLKKTPGPYTDDEDAPDLGGCKGCKYWNVCTGGCPSGGMNDNYRNRTLWCETTYTLYEKIEDDMRAMMPNINIITDAPWDAELNDVAHRWDLDINPFGAMDPSTDGRSSTNRGVRHTPVTEQIPDELLPEKTWDEKKEYWQEKYDNEQLVIDEENREIHADSDISTQGNSEWSTVGDDE